MVYANGWMGVLFTKTRRQEKQKEELGVGKMVYFAWDMMSLRCYWNIPVEIPANHQLRGARVLN